MIHSDLLGSVFVTGGTGFLGGYTLDALRATSTIGRVVIASRQSESARDVGSPEIFPLDLGRGEVLLPQGINTVIHIAGEKRDLTKMSEVNHLGTRRLAEAAVRARVRRFVYVSSVGVYGAVPHSGRINEASPHTPRNLYESSKDAGERCVREVCESAGMEWVIVQPSNVIGIVQGRSYPLLGLMKMIQRGHFAWFGQTEPWANYVGVQDVAAAIVAAATACPNRSYVVNTPARMSDVVAWISEELGVAAPARQLPPWLGQGLAEAGSWLQRILGRHMPFQRERFTELTNTTIYDPTALRIAADFRYPVGIEAEIRQMVRTYREEGLL
ncbi:NAD-dependent epimerase/dehydratase family protein [Comamonas guangdongensis]|uniref:NAD-dependent epimerase/dehydratase family protein n=1 Tax=Comamonas guangdongensis TaxID=510515 RepID=A0ABV3ZUP4_9BURK